MQLLHTVISSSEKLTHPNGQSETLNSGRGSPLLLPIMLSHYRTQTTAHVHPTRIWSFRNPESVEGSSTVIKKRGFFLLPIMLNLNHNLDNCACARIWSFRNPEFMEGVSSCQLCFVIMLTNAHARGVTMLSHILDNFACA